LKNKKTKTLHIIIYFKFDVNGLIDEEEIIPIENIIYLFIYIQLLSYDYLYQLFAMQFFVYNLPYYQNHRQIRQEMYMLVDKDFVDDLKN
jgi:hypothetical protein